MKKIILKEGNKLLNTIDGSQSLINMLNKMKNADNLLLTQPIEHSIENRLAHENKIIVPYRLISNIIDILINDLQKELTYAEEELEKL